MTPLQVHTHETNEKSQIRHYFKENCTHCVEAVLDEARFVLHMWKSLLDVRTDQLDDLCVVIILLRMIWISF